jgi:hypothetical protein
MALPAVLPLPGPRGQLSFDVDQHPLVQAFAANFGQLVPGGDVVPLGFLLLHAVLVLPGLRSRHRKACHRGPRRDVFDLRRPSDPADQNDLVYHAFRSLFIDHGQVEMVICHPIYIAFLLPPDVSLQGLNEVAAGGLDFVQQNVIGRPDVRRYVVKVPGLLADPGFYEGASPYRPSNLPQPDCLD